MTTTGLYNLHFDDFQQEIQEIVEFESLKEPCKVEDGYLNSQKSLPEYLATFGNPSSCPFCAIPLAKGSSTRLCFACGKPFGPLPAGIEGKWGDSFAAKRFQLSFKENAAEILACTEVLDLKDEYNTTTAASQPGIVDEFFTEVEPSIQEASTAPSENSIFPVFTIPVSPIQHEPKTESKTDSDFFSQLSGLGPLNANVPKEENWIDSRNFPTAVELPGSSAKLPVKTQELLEKIPDLNFMLANRLVIPDQ